MEKCSRCGRSEAEIRLFDGIYVSEPVKICERCSLIENIPIIKKPSAEQLKDSERPLGVRTRLMRLSGISNPEKHDKTVNEQLKELEVKPELEAPEEDKEKLVDNYYWLLQRQRRRKGYTTKQLAEAIQESEAAIKMLEAKSVPRDSLNLLVKLEQFLGMRLIKEARFEEQIKEELNNSAKNIEVSDKILRIEDKILDPEEERIRQEIKKTMEDKALTSSTFKRNIAERISIRDLKRASDKIDDDMEYEKKTREEVGSEQVEGFGNEDTEKLKRKVFGDTKLNKNKAKTPSIYDLAKMKEERERKLIGKDIEITKDNKEEPFLE